MAYMEHIGDNPPRYAKLALAAGIGEDAARAAREGVRRAHRIFPALRHSARLIGRPEDRQEIFDLSRAVLAAGIRENLAREGYEIVGMAAGMTASIHCMLAISDFGEQSIKQLADALNCVAEQAGNEPDAHIIAMLGECSSDECRERLKRLDAGLGGHPNIGRYVISQINEVGSRYQPADQIEAAAAAVLLSLAPTPPDLVG